MEWVTNIAGGLTPLLQVVLIALIVFIFKDEISDKFFKKKKKNGHGEVLSTLSTIKDNHLEHLAEDIKRLLILNEEERSAHREIVEEQKETNQKLDKILQDGVRIRN